MAAMWFLIQQLCKEVCWLVICSDMMDTDLFALDVVSEMMSLDVEVFRSRSILMVWAISRTPLLSSNTRQWTALSISDILASSFPSTVPSLGSRLWEHNLDLCIRSQLTMEPLPSAVEISIASGSRRNWLYTHVVTSPYHDLILPP